MIIKNLTIISPSIRFIHVYERKFDLDIIEMEYNKLVLK